MGKFSRATALGAIGFAFLSLQGCRESETLSARSAAISGTSAEAAPTSTPLPSPIELLGQTTSCSGSSYRGWKCLKRTLRTGEGLDYSVELRWNRDAVASVGSVVWVLGNNGKGSFREYGAGQGAAAQDQLDQLDSVRSIEIDFTDPIVNGEESSGGYWRHFGGYRSAASAYLAALEFVVGTGIAQGNFLNHVGGSNGTMVAAYALANLGAARYLNRVIFHAGPFISDVSLACRPDHWAGFDRSPLMKGLIQQLMGLWATGQRSQDPCALAQDRLSVLRSGVKRYPQLGVHVVMGQKEETEGFGPWILDSNLEWFHSIEAAQKTRVVRADLGHEMSWGEIRSVARLGPPAPLGSPPTLAFALSEGWFPTTTIPRDTTIYGEVRGVGPEEAYACMAELSQESVCDNPKNWTRMPNADWSYVGGVWKSRFVFSSAAFQAGSRWVGFWVNGKTGSRTARQVLELR